MSNNPTYPQEAITNPTIVFEAPEIRNGNWFIRGVDTGIKAIVLPEIGENGNYYFNGKDTGVNASLNTVPSITEDGFWRFGNYVTSIRAKYYFSQDFSGDGSAQAPLSLYEGSLKLVYVDLIASSHEELPLQSTNGTRAAVNNVAGIFIYSEELEAWQFNELVGVIVICGDSIGEILSTEVGFVTLLERPFKPSGGDSVQELENRLQAAEAQIVALVEAVEVLRQDIENKVGTADQV